MGFKHELLKHGLRSSVIWNYLKLEKMVTMKGKKIQEYDPTTHWINISPNHSFLVHHNPFKQTEKLTLQDLTVELINLSFLWKTCQDKYFPTLKHPMFYHRRSSFYLNSIYFTFILLLFRFFKKIRIKQSFQKADYDSHMGGCKMGFQRELEAVGVTQKVTPSAGGY